MRLIFCFDPQAPSQVHPYFAFEASVADSLGIPYLLVGFEPLVEPTDVRGAVRSVPEASAPDFGVYRGWMLSPERYREFYDALGELGITLVNSPEAYQHCHHFPEQYPVIAGHTPPAVWTAPGEDLSPDRLRARLPELLRPFGERPVILKDYVKSRKHEWAETCFIPSAADTEAVERVVSCFVARQGERLAGGLVFRECAELQPIGVDPDFGAPMFQEYRLFFLDGEPLLGLPYWDLPECWVEVLPVEQFLGLARSVRSRLFSMDLGRCRDGRWIVIELGDGQVNALPPQTDVAAFFTNLRRRLG